MDKTTAENFMKDLYSNSNPLLYEFRNDNIGIQPYFALVIQCLLFECSQRIWNRVIYKTWLLPSELIIIEVVKSSHQQRNPTKIRRTIKPRSSPTIYIFEQWKKLSISVIKTRRIQTFDLFDLVFSSLPLTAHTIWFCVIQWPCLAITDGQVWNCYNLFGYRLYNYVFSRYVEFTREFFPKLYFLIKNRKTFRRKTGNCRHCCSNAIFYISLSSSIITFLFLGVLIFPYLITHVIPMTCIYQVIFITYIYFIVVISIFMEYFIPFKNYFLFLRKIFKNDSHLRRAGIHTGIKILPYIVGILFNLSQSFYYGSDYWQTIGKEIDSRESKLYLYRIGYSPDQIFHTILTTL
ncbi:unnamed protein product [Adineta ricciae]|uniref:Uncharacterized protein n=1 Tax=Adineta ricciae TaxID=249248 RepID=A0A815J2Y6_ADIRI|nr:unnamed protein product [Adineta ricciae]CAF1374864.1 unnamed protein product [Adineta ricciae]